MILVDKFAIALLILIVWYYLNKLLESFKGEQELHKESEKLREQTRLDFLERQIVDLYSPLLGMIQFSRNVHEIYKKRLQETQNPGKVKEFFHDTYFIPNNSEMARLIRTKIHLLETKGLPDTYSQFLQHQAQLEAVHRLGKEKNIKSDDLMTVDWPKRFEADVDDSLTKLKEQYKIVVPRSPKDHSRDEE